MIIGVTFDDLITITADFYMSDEVKGTVTSVYAHVDQRPPACKGLGKDRKAIADVLKLVLNPLVKLPTYVAVDISRLPPVAVEHLDTSALLQELAILRPEVRAIQGRLIQWARWARAQGPQASRGPKQLMRYFLIS